MSFDSAVCIKYAFVHSSPRDIDKNVSDIIIKVFLCSEIGNSSCTPYCNYFIFRLD